MAGGGVRTALGAAASFSARQRDVQAGSVPGGDRRSSSGPGQLSAMRVRALTQAHVNTGKLPKPGKRHHRDRDPFVCANRGPPGLRRGWCADCGAALRLNERGAHPARTDHSHACTHRGCPRAEAAARVATRPTARWNDDQLISGQRTIRVGESASAGVDHWTLTGEPEGAHCDWRLLGAPR